MNDETRLQLFRQAWVGIDAKPNGERVRDRYLHRLRTANTHEQRRSVCTELLAEGLLAVGGYRLFRTDADVLDLWRSGEADAWREIRDAAMFASVLTDPE